MGINARSAVPALGPALARNADWISCGGRGAPLGKIRRKPKRARRWRKQSRAARTTVQISPDSIQLRGINLKTNPTTVVRVDLPQLRKSLRALETLSVEAVLDGEIVALNGDGSHPQRSMQDNRAGALLLYKRCPA